MYNIFKFVFRAFQKITSLFPESYKYIISCIDKIWDLFILIKQKAVEFISEIIKLAKVVLLIAFFYMARWKIIHIAYLATYKYSKIITQSPLRSSYIAYDDKIKGNLYYNVLANQWDFNKYYLQNSTYKVILDLYKKELLYMGLGNTLVSKKLKNGVGFISFSDIDIYLSQIIKNYLIRKLLIFAYLAHVVSRHKVILLELDRWTREDADINNCIKYLRNTFKNKTIHISYKEEGVLNIDLGTTRVSFLYTNIPNKAIEKCEFHNKISTLLVCKDFKFSLFSASDSDRLVKNKYHHPSLKDRFNKIILCNTSDNGSLPLGLFYDELLHAKKAYDLFLNKEIKLKNESVSLGCALLSDFKNNEFVLDYHELCIYIIETFYNIKSDSIYVTLYFEKPVLFNEFDLNNHNLNNYAFEQVKFYS